MRTTIEVKKRNAVGLRLELKLECYIQNKRKGLSGLDASFRSHLDLLHVNPSFTLGRASGQEITSEAKNNGNRETVVKLGGLGFKMVFGRLSGSSWGSPGVDPGGSWGGPGSFWQLPGSFLIRLSLGFLGSS